MTDKEKFERLVHPTPMFKIFEQTQEKIQIVAKHLMEGYLNVSDEHRNYDIIHYIIQSYIKNPFTLMYEIGDCAGLLGFTDISPKHKTNVFLKIFNKDIWGKTVVREGQKVLDLIVETFELKRLSTQSADPIVVKMCKQFFGFEIEGRKRQDFSWDGELYDNYILGRVTPEKIEEE